MHGLKRCDAEIERCLAELRAGGADLDGLLLGLYDWSRERELMSAGPPKQLFASISPIPGEDLTELELVFGGREIGSLTIHQNHFADFVEGLRSGFTVVIQPAAKPGVL